MSFVFSRSPWAYGKEKIRGGGRKEICPTLSDCARVVKKNFPEKLSKIVVDGGGGVITKISYQIAYFPQN
jgi:hypothetical protein